jgi:hypothetical protein
MCDVQKMVLGVRNTQSITYEVWSLCFPGFCCISLIISLSLCDIVSVIHYDVTICMKLDPGIHIGSTWFSSENRVWQVASRILTTKIPCVPLVTITWLQQTWCPRFRRGTFGYGITTSPNKRDRVGVWKFPMRMHVSSPKVPKCICYAMHTLK